MPRTSSEEVAGMLLDDPEGGTNQGFREAKEVRWRGAANLGRETSSPALTKNLVKKLPIAECTACTCNALSITSNFVILTCVFIRTYGSVIYKWPSHAVPPTMMARPGKLPPQLPVGKVGAE